MSAFSIESDEYKRGQRGEHIVSFILRGIGYYVIPSYDYTGGDENNKAPRMQGHRLALVIPDLDICKSGTRKWVEVKTKEAATFTRITNRDEHGIDKRHYEQYLKVQAESGCEVIIAVYEEKTAEVRGVTLNNAREGIRFNQQFNNGRGGYFWARDKMFILARIKLIGEMYDIEVSAKLRPQPIGDWKPIGQIAGEIVAGLRMRLRFVEGRAA